MNRVRSYTGAGSLADRFARKAIRDPGTSPHKSSVNIDGNVCATRLLLSPLSRSDVGVFVFMTISLPKQIVKIARHVRRCTLTDSAIYIYDDVRSEEILPINLCECTRRKETEN